MTDTTETTADTGSAATETDSAADDTTPTAEGRDDGVQPQDGTEADDDDTEPTGRAARYRQRAKDAEERADQLAATVERLQRNAIDAAIGKTGLQPAAVWAVSELADLLDDDGTPDSGKITAAADKARQQLGIPKTSVAHLRNNQLRSGAGLPAPQRDGWADAFGPKDQ
jgi:hypothetical protein